MSDQLTLFPYPRELRPGQGTGPDAATRPTEVADTSLPAQGYALTIDANRVELRHADEAGLRYGRATLAQIARGRSALPALEIRDWPDFPTRGYMLDVSRDRVPTRETLERIVEVLDLCRINHLELYTEHTFAYREHEAVWRDASPITGEDVGWLDELCDARGIALVANQNTFGHMGRWLQHPEYQERAEAIDGYTTKIGLHISPGVLEPSDENADFALDLCKELLSYHRHRKINIGCDETFELGKGRSRARVEAEGRERVYLDHLLKLIHGLRKDDIEVAFWGDILRDHPELATELPKEGVTALAWHYEAPTEDSPLPDAIFELLSEFGITREALRGFDAHVDGFAKAGVPFWVCPGTSSWNTLIGRLDNARGNLLDAATVGLERGACGYLITDWGDSGHMQPPSISWPAMAYGGGVAWCRDANHERTQIEALDAWIFEDEAQVLGGLLERIGHLHKETGKVGMNGSPLFTELLAKGGALGSMGEADPDATAATLEALESARLELDQARPACADGDIVIEELRAALRLARHGAWRIARAAGFEAPSTEEMHADLVEATELQRQAWLKRSRPGGFRESVARLEATLQTYADEA